MRALLVHLCVFAVCASCAADPVATSSSFKLNGSLQWHAQKRLWEDGNDNAVDKSYIRGNFGADYAAPDFSAEINLRIFAPQFSATGADRFLMDRFRVEYKLNPQFSLRAGRWSNDLCVTGMYGNYLDMPVDTGRIFFARGYSHDGGEVLVKSGPVTSSIIVAGLDDKLSHGYVRIVETIKPSATGLSLDLGWRGNVLDSLSFPGAKPPPSFRYFLRFMDTIVPHFMPYAELAAFSNGIHVETITTVANVGFELPTGLRDTQLFVEGEYMKDREVSGHKRPLDWDFAVVQTLGKRTQLFFSTFSDPTSTSPNDVELGARLSVSFE